VAVAPIPDGAGAHVTIELDFRGFGMGKLIMPMVVREARKEVAASCEKLRSRLETGYRPLNSRMPGPAGGRARHTAG
jgi:hypothetical protein